MLRYWLPIFALSALALLPNTNEDIARIVYLLPQFDKLQHLLAGGACGIFGAYIWTLCPGDTHPHLRRRMTLLLALLVGLAVGSLWEVMELLCPWLNTPPPVRWDTTADLLMDILGSGITALWYAEKVR
jgi:hypothetical protein